jgi:chromosome segregation ATPase
MAFTLGEVQLIRALLRPPGEQVPWKALAGSGERARRRRRAVESLEARGLVETLRGGRGGLAAVRFRVEHLEGVLDALAFRPGERPSAAEANGLLAFALARHREEAAAAGAAAAVEVEAARAASSAAERSLRAAAAEREAAIARAEAGEARWAAAAAACEEASNASAAEALGWEAEREARQEEGAAWARERAALEARCAEDGPARVAAEAALAEEQARREHLEADLERSRAAVAVRDTAIARAKREVADFEREVRGLRARLRRETRGAGRAPGNEWMRQGAARRAAEESRAIIRRSASWRRSSISGNVGMRPTRPLGDRE